MTDYQTISLGGIDVCFTSELDGGGARYGQDYLDFLPNHVGTAERTFEWCAGPGFIGFALLGRGLTRTLCLADINPAAVAACRETIARNNLHERVTLYESQDLDDVPATERWDLVVGNPPHSDRIRPQLAHKPAVLYCDPDWEGHKRFYATIGSHLTAGANVVIQENRGFSSAETFTPMLEAGGLQFVDAPRCRTAQAAEHYFYVWSRPLMARALETDRKP